MTFQGLLSSVGGEVVWQVVGTGFALVAALASAVSVVQRRPVSPWLLVLGPALAATVVFVVGRITLLAAGAGPEEQRLAVTTFAVGSLIGPLTFGPVVATSLGALAVAGARWPPARILLGLAAIGCALAVAGLVAWGGVSSGFPIYPGFRALVYLVVGVFVAVAVSGPHEAGTSAGALFPLVVAVGEGSERGLVNLLIVLQAGNVPPEKWAAAVGQMVDIVAPQWTASLVALAVATLFSGIVVLSSSRGRDTIGAAAVAAVVAWAVLLGAKLGAALLLTSASG